MLIVCHGETSPAVMQDAIISMRQPRKVVTMDEVWWEVAASMNLPRYFFKVKLALMHFVADKDATALIVERDPHEDTWSMAASLETMGLRIWPVLHVEV